MTICEKCAEVIEGMDDPTVVIVSLFTEHEFVCLPCWEDFKAFRLKFEEGQQSLDEYTRKS